ncbi:MAG TPA: glycosyltransferase family 4 protein [Bryobacteraceae bacterium]|nr:glycosyltransferase family 4 protein [Bryobacteraceae bacterium]
MRFLVVQMGARMHYAVPAILARRGMLAELWTDMHADDWPARLSGVLPAPLRTTALQSMRGRRLPGEIDRSLVRSFPARAIWARLQGEYVDGSVRRKLLKRGFGAAEGLYSLMFSDVETIAQARRRGLFVAFEQVIAPDFPSLLFEERERFPGIEAQEKPEDDANYLRAHRRIWNDATAILAPSGYVRDAIVKLGGAAGKVRLVPYAVDESWLQAEPDPEPGRVLFVGSVGLRKGNHYLAEAARLLAERRVPCQIRVVGPMPANLHSSPLFAGPRYVGQIPRTEVREEFLRADMFVLPTLAEGSATAHIEALACGLPVVTTPNCGTWIRDGVEGFLAPVRDAAALADRIEGIVTNRVLRAGMSAAARQLALREHTWARYEERLVETLSPGPDAAAQTVSGSLSVRP